MNTMLVSIIIPNDGAPLVTTVVWPLGSIERISLKHDWGHDTWNWRGGRLPDSMLRWLRDNDLRLHGERLVYTSPAYVGTSSNETGRMTVYEVDYEVD